MSVAFGGHQRTVIVTSVTTTVIGGLDNPCGLAFSPGALYVIEAGRGAAILAPPTATSPCVTVRQEQLAKRHRQVLTMPTSIVVGPDGALYVTNHATSVGAGEVVRIEL